MNHLITLIVFVFSVISFSSLAGGTIDFTPHGSQPGLSHQLSSVDVCQGCHKRNGLPDDKINMPYSTWVGSMKANAGRDPLFWAALDVANNDIPGVGDYCLKCHAPRAWFEGRVVKPTDNVSPLLDGSNGCELTGSHVAAHGTSNDFEGVSCHFCHRIDESGPLGEPQILQNGSVWVDDESCPDGGGGDPCRKGPYHYDNGGGPPHVWEYSPFIQSSEFCGSCHNVSSPTIEQNGELSIARKFWHEGVQTELAMPIERTYSEWKESYFADLIFKDPFNELPINDLPVLNQGQTCQDCHMPNSDSVDARACVFDMGGFRTNDLKTHQFAGGNTWIPQVIKAIYGDDLELNDSYFKEALDLTTGYAFDMLQNKSALIEPQVVSVSNDWMNVDVKVTNLTGHKLPTGYPEGRRMWINLKVRNGINEVIWESGAYDVATGELTEDTQIKIYESLQGQWNELANGGLGACEINNAMGKKQFHFALNNCIVKDNRIPPLGFRGGSNIELQPVGINFPNHPDNVAYLVNYDITQYTVPLTNETGPFSIEATLKYQIASDEYIEFLDQESIDNGFATENQMCDRSWTQGPADMTRAGFMKQLWETYGRSEPVDMVMQFIDNISP